MVKRFQKQGDGLYHIHGQKFEELIGTRAKVWHGTAYKTAGGLTKKDIIMNKHGRIVSKIKQATAKRDRRLEKAGYKPVKGQFVPMQKHSGRSTRGRSTRGRSTRKRR